MNEQPWSEVTQTILHDPSLTEEQINTGRHVLGNCMQAAIASVLKMPIDAVPHVVQFVWWPQALELWLRQFDLTLKSEQIDTIPERLCIVSGTSPRGVSHVVVAHAGEIVWDPHPSRDGLVSVRTVWWFEPAPATLECWFCKSPWTVMESAS